VNGVENLLPIIIPSLIAMAVSVVGYFLIRKSSKESNDTNAFSAVTDQLFRLNESLGRKIEELEKKVTTLESLAAAVEAEKDGLKLKLDAVEAELRDMKVVNGALGRYLGKLVRLWPTGTTLPQADEPVEWGQV
jgi:CHASE3 domain sensor protein